mmetsp:Transcript_29727/g.45477  ORF Transcript_29727/g.45477 Transcript_29727/m.45477 type:complete len:347 (+) Transcript_29727:89-1129(+)
MATSRFAKVTASSILVLAASTSASWVLLLEKGTRRNPQQLLSRKSTLTSRSSSSSRQTGPFVREIQVPSIETQRQSVALSSSFSSYVTSLGRSARSIWSPPLSSNNQIRQSSSSGQFKFNVSDTDTMVKSIQNRFRVGDYYVWIYRDSNNQPTSWEKYSVDSVDDENNDVVVINMSTKFSEEEEFVTHHRMTVDLADNLQAIDGKDSWRLCGFEYKDGETDTGGDTGGEMEMATVANWKQFGTGENVQAFEEKFDVFNMLLRAGPPNVETTAEEIRMVKLNRDITPLVRTHRHGYTQAWYAPPEHGQLSGIAVLKEFEEHSFTLIESGRDDGIGTGCSWVIDVECG